MSKNHDKFTDPWQQWIAPHQLVAGVDEVGRGPIAGPVVAAAVILPLHCSIEGIKDSKLLSASKRESLYSQITTGALAWSVGRAEVEEIDKINILQATLLAMKRAVDSLSVVADVVLVDGNRCPEIESPCQAIIKGDTLVSSIAAASIVAKVTRDREMINLHAEFPEYGFDQHKGYGTKAHLNALQEFGPIGCHRRSFAPVKNHSKVK
ncbi:MAG TPA: ribonuclease HII [Gammaproteobacteria bacterium]|nr:ribonuclease HII [Gammaproteobacteria bacterium]